ncbi:MAG: hypothetical protein M0R06_00530 [Sphaerochaeta sp.]|jgi:hypothetical protein|nr:hypothetical protein [Sphaerochaeta sp.]
MKEFWSENQAWIIPILVFLWTVYSRAVYEEWVSVWTDKTLSTGKKVLYSIRALASAAGPAALAVWKQYGGVIKAAIATWYKNRMGVPAAIQRVKAVKR